MFRYESLLEGMNKGVDFKRIREEVEGRHQIANWSPNNVKRLIISGDRVIIQYHISGGKYTYTLDKYSLKNELNKDIGNMQAFAYGQSKTAYKPITRVLTAGRVCTHLEEIIFVNDKYPNEMLTADITYMTTALREKDFLRMMYVTVFNGTMDEVVEVLKENKGVKDGLLTEHQALRDKIQLYYTAEFKDYWNKYKLRSTIYLFDEKIREKLEGVQAKKEKEAEQDPNSEANKRKRVQVEKANKEQEEKDKTILLANKELYTIYHVTKDLLMEQTEVGIHLAPFYQSLWAHPMVEQFMFRYYTSYLRERTTYDKFQSINTQIILEKAHLLSNSEHLVESCKLLDTFVKGRNENKEEGLKESLEKLTAYMRTLLYMSYSSIYTAFSIFLTNSAPDMAHKYITLLTEEPFHIEYDRRIVEYSNYIMVKFAKYGEFDNATSEGFKDCGYTLVENMTLAVKVEQAKSILKLFRDYHYNPERKPHYELFAQYR